MSNRFISRNGWTVTETLDGEIVRVAGTHNGTLFILDPYGWVTDTPIGDRSEIRNLAVIDWNDVRDFFDAVPADRV